MKITDLLNEKSILLGAAVSSKQETIDQVVSLMEKNGNVQDLAAYKQAVLAREEQSSTGVGEGIAIPHAKTAAITAPGLAAMTVPAGVDYDSLDGAAVNLVFLIAAPESGENAHLEILSRLSTMLMICFLPKTVKNFYKLLTAPKRLLLPKKPNLQKKKTAMMCWP